MAEVYGSPSRGYRLIAAPAFDADQKEQLPA
jgi:hypothetical protein